MCVEDICPALLPNSFKEFYNLDTICLDALHLVIQHSKLRKWERWKFDHWSSWSNRVWDSLTKNGPYTPTLPYRQHKQCRVNLYGCWRYFSSVIFIFYLAHKTCVNCFRLFSPLLSVQCSVDWFWLTAVRLKCISCLAFLSLQRGIITLKWKCVTVDPWLII